MIKMKRNGFTLPEVLITLTIVGTLAALVLPGIIKDAQMRVNMALLQSTVVNLSDVVHQELIRTRAKSINDTDIYSNPQAFLNRNFDYAKSGQNIFRQLSEDGEYIMYQYQKMAGGDGGSSTPTGQIILKNGVYVGIYKSSRFRFFVVDINGPEKPNIIGVDYFVLDIADKDYLSDGVRLGDVGASQEYTKKTTSDLKTLCRTGNSQACYALVERSGFNPRYMEE